ncbi:YhjD/YihY/BrkB family envelope integrity protein [Actinocorallia longicatena]|uniref:YhjD/YihY/BrkB family envelope integrity protein n=1 Tax=Actinocorallia longicatena TaxID=111803 RepID=UPI0031DB864B
MPGIGTIIRAYTDYYSRGMQHVAGSVTYFGIITVFPLLALLYALAAQIVAHSPEALARLNESLDQSLGVDADLGTTFLKSQASATARAVVGTLGVTGVLYAGRLWVDAYRRALRGIWDVPIKKSPYPVRFVRDIAILLVIVAALVVMVALGIFTTPGPYRYLRALGHDLSYWVSVPCQILAGALTILWSALLCSGLYHRLGRAPLTRPVRHAALLAGVCLAVLTVGGLLLLKHAFADPLYGMALAMLGLMLWVSAAARITLAMAVWAASGGVGAADQELRS